MRDSGRYSCTASNSLGHVSYSWTLLVNREYISWWILGVVTLIRHCMPQAVQVLQLHTLVGSCHPNLQAKGKVTAHTPPILNQMFTAESPQHRHSPVPAKAS